MKSASDSKQNIHKIEVIESTEFKKWDSICHGVFTRKGGVSQGPYASLNCSFGRQDSSQHVQENRRLAMAHLGYPPEALLTSRSEHGNRAFHVKVPYSIEQKPLADALVTRLSNVILGFESADCPIILFFDPRESLIGIAHAGWRGAHSGIVEATVQLMCDLGSQSSDIAAVICPCISQESYEVGTEVYSSFLNKNEKNKKFFISSKHAQHYMFDLRGYVKELLLELGLQNVSAIEIDTYQDEEQFFSCRRAFHRGDIEFGGHLSFIQLRN